MKGYVSIRNSMIQSKGYSAAKRLEVALLAVAPQRKSKNGEAVRYTQKTYAELKRISGIRSDATLHRAISALTDTGLVRILKCYRVSEAEGKSFKDANLYVIDEARIEEDKKENGYTLVPRELLSMKLTNAQFSVALAVYMYAGSSGCAWCSISLITKLLGIARSTVCAALKVLRKKNMFVRCLKRYIGKLRGKTGHHVNNYYLTNSPFAPKKKKSAPNYVILTYNSSPNIEEQNDINNRTRVVYSEGRNKGNRFYDSLRDAHSLSDRTRLVPKLCRKGEVCPFWGKLGGDPRGHRPSCHKKITPFSLKESAAGGT